MANVKRRIRIDISPTEYIDVSVASNDSVSLTTTIDREHGSLYDAALDGVESLVMAFAALDSDIDESSFVRAIQEAVEAIANVYGD